MSHAAAPPTRPFFRRSKVVVGWLAIAAITLLSVLTGYILADRTARASIDIPAIQNQVADLLTSSDIRSLVHALRGIVAKPEALPFHVLVFTSTGAAVVIGAWMGFRRPRLTPMSAGSLAGLAVRFAFLGAGALVAFGFATTPSAMQSEYYRSPLVEAVRQQLPPQPEHPSPPRARPPWAQPPGYPPISIQKGLDTLANGQRQLTIMLALAIPFAAFLPWVISYALFQAPDPPAPPTPPPQSASP